MGRIYHAHWRNTGGRGFKGAVEFSAAPFIKRKGQVIFKIQIAIAGNQGRTALAYNEDSSIMGEYPADKVTKKLMKGRSKAFFDGDYDAVTGKININHEVEDPGW